MPVSACSNDMYYCGEVIAADGRRVPLSAFIRYGNVLAGDRVFHADQFAVAGGATISRPA